MEYLCNYGNKILSGEGEGESDDSPEKCRERRRRRIEKRRLVSTYSSSSPPSPRSLLFPPSSLSSSSTYPTVSSDMDMNPAGVTAGVSNLNLTGNVVDTVPVVGAMSLAGRKREMEDAISVRMNLCCPNINGRRPIHFVGVFDGHGGAHVAALCRDSLHQLLVEELMRVPSTEAASASGVGGSSSSLQEGYEEAWRTVLRRSFQRMDEVAGDTCSCGSLASMYNCPPDEVSLSGSTAVVAVLTLHHIIVANCGDSRAVLCRGGRAIPLSVDHKPDREDERARIETVGGRVIISDGARVEGILAMSRAIGKRYSCEEFRARADVSDKRFIGGLEVALSSASAGGGMASPVLADPGSGASQKVLIWLRPRRLGIKGELRILRRELLNRRNQRNRMVNSLAISVRSRDT